MSNIHSDLTAFEKDKQVISGAPITRDITGEEFYSTIYSCNYFKKWSSLCFGDQIPRGSLTSRLLMKYHQHLKRVSLRLLLVPQDLVRNEKYRYIAWVSHASKISIPSRKITVTKINLHLIVLEVSLCFLAFWYIFSRYESKSSPH